MIVLSGESNKYLYVNYITSSFFVKPLSYAAAFSVYVPKKEREFCGF